MTKLEGQAVDQASAFPCRETSSDGQLNLNGARPVLERFKAMCKAGRRAYYDMLEVLMDAYEIGSQDYRNSAS